MKVSQNVRKVSLAVAANLILTIGAWAQETVSTQPPPEPKTVEVAPRQTPAPETAKVETGANQTVAAQVAADAAQTTAAFSDDAQVADYYVNYLKEYRLGPEDVISVDVFGQPNYSKAGINIPPTAVIAYPLIPGGVFVGGKTTTQIEKEIAKKLDEFIIDPQVTVTLEKVGSARYAVMGDVAQPGIRLMTRRVTAMSALMEAGGVLPTGSRSKAIVYRNGTNGFSQIPVNLDLVMKGKAEDVEIQPGDQIFIPGNRMKTFNNILDTVSKASAFRLLFGVPF